jgi:YgiT-type zinc finger domain-containing protein
MKCAICKNGETDPQKITVTLERNGTTLVIKDVPAEVCTNCGEEYVSAQTNKELLQRAESSIAKGAELELLKFAA